MGLGYSQRFNDLMAKGRMRSNLIELSMCDPPRFGFRPDPSVYGLSMESVESGYPSAREELITGIIERTKSYTGVSIDRNNAPSISFPCE
jgi:hypothetical protein